MNSGHQGQDHVVAGRDDRRRQHGMIKLDLAVRAFCASGNVGSRAFASKNTRFRRVRSACAGRGVGDAFMAAWSPNRCDGLIEHSPANARDARDRASNGCDCPSGFSPCQTAYGNSRSCALPQASAEGKKRIRLHEEQRKRRQGRCQPSNRPPSPFVCPERPRRWPSGTVKRRSRISTHTLKSESRFAGYNKIRPPDGPFRSAGSLGWHLTRVGDWSKL